MIPNELLIKRLAHIKQLFRIGIEQSKQNESVAVFSILTFQDSVEMFLNLLSEHKGIDSKNFKFLDYWDKIPDLTFKESMRKLNDRRVNLKHKGLLPAKSDIEVSRVNASDFFEENTFKQFGINFLNISLVDLVSYDEVRQYLSKAEEELNNGNNEECVLQTAYAFNVLLSNYGSNKRKWGYSPFSFGPSLTFQTSFNLRIEERNLAKFVDTMKESLESLRNVVEIISYGIDYREFVKFDFLTPYISRTISGNMHAHLGRKKKWTKENSQYCIDFVIKSALILQDFDFDIESLDDTLPEFILPTL